MGDIRTKRLVLILATIVVFFLAAAVVAWLWNSIVPWMIGFPPVTYWQAAGLLLLTRLLFGGLLRGIYPWRTPAANAHSEDTDPMPVEQRSEYLLRRRALLDDVDDR